MKRASVRSGLFTIVFLWVALGLAAAQDQQPNTAPTAAPMAGATISEWKGKIHLILPGQPPSAPVRGEVLPAGATLETGSGRLLLQLADGSQVLVRSHTHLIVQQPTPTDRGYFQLLLGHIRALINKRTGGAPPFELGTPSAVIAVRGTQFDVEVNRKQETKVHVFEGVVEVFGRHSGTSVLVQAGFSTRVGVDTPPEKPRPSNEKRTGDQNTGSNGKGFAKGRKKGP